MALSPTSSRAGLPSGWTQGASGVVNAVGTDPDDTVLAVFGANNTVAAPLVVLGKTAGSFYNVIAAVIEGLLIAGTHAAPADGDLIGGECVLWFDQTNGVGNTKLMLKGKSADGTVKTATILLA